MNGKISVFELTNLWGFFVQAKLRRAARAWSWPEVTRTTPTTASNLSTPEVEAATSAETGGPPNNPAIRLD